MLFPHNGIFLMTPPTLRFSFPPNVSRVCDKAVARGIAFIRPCCEEVCDSLGSCGIYTVFYQSSPIGSITGFVLVEFRCRWIAAPWWTLHKSLGVKNKNE